MLKQDPYLGHLLVFAAGAAIVSQTSTFAAPSRAVGRNASSRMFSGETFLPIGTGPVLPGSLSKLPSSHRWHWAVETGHGGNMDKQPAILSIGSINADFQVRVDRRPELSETLIGTDFLRTSGGKAANVAFLAHRLGSQAVLVGHVGQGSLADQALRPLRSAGIDLTHVTRVPGCDTAVSMITVPPDGKKGIVLAPNANAVWSRADVAAVDRAVDGMAPGSVVVIDCEVPAFVGEAAAAAAARKNLTRLLDPSPADAVTDRLLKDADIVVPNPTEAETLTGITVGDARSAVRASRRLLQRGPRAVCIKLPEGGCILAEATGLHRIDTGSSEAVDTTGAGDAFAGAMAIAIAERRGLVEAAALAVAAADHAVTGYGSQPAYPDRTQLAHCRKRVAVTALESDDR